MKPIDIIVVTFNRIDYFKVFVEFLFLFTDHSFRLIVVDNGSQDGTRELILKLEKEGVVWKHVFNKENLPLAAAQTEGFKQVESELFVVVDDDMTPPMFKYPCWLTLLSYKILADEDVGCINFHGVRKSYRAFNIKSRPGIYERIKREGGKRLEVFNKMQKLLHEE